MVHYYSGETVRRQDRPRPFRTGLAVILAAVSIGVSVLAWALGLSLLWSSLT